MLTDCRGNVIQALTDALGGFPGTIFSWITVNYDNMVDSENDLRDIKRMLQMSVSSPDE